jgi:trk system potassium uptake protein TrkH
MLLIVLAAAMLLCAGADIYIDHADWKAFAASAFFTSFVGGGLLLSNQGKTQNLTLKQAFILTTFSWVALALFAAVPFLLADINVSATDALFEAMSGITTTGGTVLKDLDNLPPGILLWRAILQWIGGIGIIVFAIAVLPMLRIGGMQLFRTESSDNSEKILPRAGQIAGAIGSLYLTLTIICAMCYWMAGMSGFDALCHALTTIATGGFSTHDASLGHFENIRIELIAMFFMVLGGIPFILLIQFLRGKHLAIINDAQVRWYLSIIAITVLTVTAWLVYSGTYTPFSALRYASFNIISIITTTGYASADYNLWGPFMITVFFLVGVTGGCTGSTSGGIKIFRYQVLYQTAKSQILQLIQPHGVFRPLYKKKPLPEVVSSSVMSFFILFAFCFSVIAMLLSLTGLDFLTSMSSAASALANVGPALGDTVGPAGDFSSFADEAKWLLTFAMLIGRLEIFTVLVLLAPQFWRD